MFFSLYILIAAFCVVGVTAAGLLTFRSASRRITDQHVEGSRLFLAEAVTAINLIIETIFDSAAQFQDDSIIAALIARGGTDDALERQAIITRLGQIRDSGKYIHSVTLFLARSGQVYDTGYGFCGLAAFPDHGWRGAYESSDRQITLIDHRELATSAHSGEAGIEVITLLTRLPVGRLRPEGALVVNIDPGAVYDEVVSPLGLGRGELIVVGRDGRRILGEDPARAELPRLLAALGLESSAVLRVDRGTLLATRAASSLLGWDFIWTRPFGDVGRALAALRAVVVASSGALLAGLLALGLLIARRTTGPMDDLMAAIEPPAGGSLNPLREIRAFVDDVLVRSRSLAEKLESTMPLYRERFLHELLTGKGGDPASVDARLAEFGVDLTHRVLTVVALETLNMYELREKWQQVGLARLGLSELVERGVRERSLTAYTVHGEESRLDLIISQAAADQGQARRDIGDFAGELVVSAGRIGMDLAAGVSGSSGNPAELARLASESRLALERRRLGCGERVVVYGEGGGGQAVPGPPLADSEQDLRHALALGDGDRACEVVRSVLARLQAGAAPPALSEMIVQLYGLVTRCAVEPVTPKGGKPLLQVLAEIRTVSAADLFLSRLVSAVCAQRQAIERGAEGRHHRRIIEYVDRHYENPAMSMDLLASSLRLSPSYVYRILKDWEKRTFVELLTERRIERARGLLLQNLKVQDVAARVGFSSAKYFIRVFKQQTGYTPDRYRKAV